MAAADAAGAVPDTGTADEKEEFFKNFRAEQQSIREALDALVAEGAAAGSAQVNERLDALLVRVQAMEVAFTCAAHDLHRYGVQRCRETCRSLEAEIAKLREQLAPRKKFGFKRNAAPKPAAAPVAAVAAPAGDAGYQTLDGQKQQPAISSSAPATTGNATEAFNGELFENLTEELISRGAGELAGRDVTLRGLQNCQIVLLDRIGAMHCHGLRGCEIIVGAIGSSALFYDCKDCLITLAAKQLRFHDSERVALQLHTLSGPVIEHCRRMLFSPHDLRYPGIQDHVNAASLGELPECGAKTVSGMWSDIQDFNWHKRQASPNWRIPPADLRRQPLQLASVSDLPEPPSQLERLKALFDRCQGCWEDAEPAERLADEDEF